MKFDQIAKIVHNTDLSPSKWELDTIIWWDRTTNKKSLLRFFDRINTLKTKTALSVSEQTELENLLELLDELEEQDCKDLLRQTEDEAKDAFIEHLFRVGAIQILTNGKMDYDIMETACKLSPNDFIMCAKRTQDLISQIQGLVIKGETLSKDVAGA